MGNTQKYKERSQKKTRNNRVLKHIASYYCIKKFLLAIYDVIVANGAYLLALWLRFDCRYTEIPNHYLTAWVKYIPIQTIVCLVIFKLLNLYLSLWKFASYNELKRCVIAVLLSSLLHAAGITVMFHCMPISYYVIGAGIELVLVLVVRFLYRFVFLERSKKRSICKKLFVAE